MNKYILSTLFIILLQFKTFSQSDSSYIIDEIKIIALKIPNSKSSFSISKIDSAALAGKQSYSINEYLNNFAGIFALSSNNFAQDTRLSSRGFGSRAAFGIRGIKIIVDDIPSSTPDGQAQLDDVDFTLMNNIELLRGPSAGIYGNSSGGMLNINSNEPGKGPLLSLKTAVGSYNYVQLKAATNFSFKKTAWTFSLNRTVLEGYRKWSEYTSNIATIRGKINLSSKSTLLANISYLSNPVANDPGGVNEDELKLGRKLPRDRNEFFFAGENVNQFKNGLIYSFKDKNDFLIKAKTYFVSRQFENALPFENAGIVTIDRIFAGASLDLSKKLKWKNNSFTFLLGGEYENQNDDRKQFANLKNLIGKMSFDQTEVFTDLGIYFLTNINLKDKWNFDLNVRYDKINTKAKDKFLSDGNQSASKYQNVINPTFAVNYRLNKKLWIGSVFSSGFENPTLNELSNNPNGLGGFNPDLKPMKSLNYELNAKYNSRKLYGQLALFHIDSKDEIIAYELPNQNGRSYYRNAGNTSRTGVELELKYLLNSKFLFRFNNTFSKFKYAEYLIYNGNKLPGIPEYNSNLNLEYHQSDRLSFFLENSFVSSITLNDANTFSAPSWSVSNIRANYELKFLNKEFVFNFGLNNIFNVDYFSNLRINAAANRFYEAAPDRNYFFGVTFNYK